MNKAKVLITSDFPTKVMDELQKRFDLIKIDVGSQGYQRSDFLNAIKNCDAILSLLTDKIDKEVIDHAENLKVISNYAVGYNNIDIDYASKKGIAVCFTPGVLTETSADLTWALILAAARKIVPADIFVRTGKFRGWTPQLFLGSDVNSKTLGIIGLGRIGQAVAKRAIGFNMDVVYYSRTRNVQLEKEMGYKFLELASLLSCADFVSIHLPLNADTKHLIRFEQLKLFKPTAFLINTSRGEVIEEAALVTALRENLIAGAALDVYEYEPAISPGLFELDNVTLAPHIGSASLETRTKMGLMAIDNISSVLSGIRPKAIVNPKIELFD
ncbi:MAG: D-glycerate dehydrogenase [Bdellovibrionales bacterium]|nr:D-glycerate dehydrogenase [Bdellovibrionales bacterium]